MALIDPTIVSEFVNAIISINVVDLAIAGLGYMILKQFYEKYVRK